MINQRKQFRVGSIDILRALTMVLMIFVNDLWSLTNIPDWLEHTAGAEDGMGLADTVFPAFLFITGMSIPLAVNHRRNHGESTGNILLHIVLRSAALLIMGVFLVNGESISESGTGMKRVIWNTICCTCFILIWNNWSKNLNRVLIRFIRIASLLVLIILAWFYRGESHDGGVAPFATHWWGILGLIGWAYLVSACVFALSRNSFAVVVIAWLVFIFLCIASHAHWLMSVTFLSTILSPLGGGAMPALVTGGVLASMIFQHYSSEKDDSKMVLVLVATAVLLLLAGFYTRTFFGISKIRATPAWVLICSAITILFFLLIHWIADLKGKAGWFKIVRPAGINTLLCYLLPYYAYTIVVLSGIALPARLLSGGVGLIKSLCFSLLMVAVTGLLGKAGLRLKL